MYRAFGCTGPRGFDIVVEAMNKAFDDNIITISVGGGGGWPEDPVNVVAKRMVAQEVLVMKV
jgi:hypothetical protein